MLLKANMAATRVVNREAGVASLWLNPCTDPVEYICEVM